MPKKKRKFKTSPTKRSLDYLRNCGWEVAVTERWNPFSKRKNDLYRFIDILCMNTSRGFLAVQTTAFPHANERIRKIQDLDTSKTFLLAGGRIQVHEWKKVKSRWQVKVIQYEG